MPFVYFMDVITGETSLCRPCLLQNFLVCNDIFHSQRMPSREGALVLFVSFAFTAQILYILIKCKLNKSIRYLFWGNGDGEGRAAPTTGRQAGAGPVRGGRRAQGSGRPVQLNPCSRRAELGAERDREGPAPRKAFLEQ